MKISVDASHREAVDIVLKVSRLDLAFAEWQTAWDEFRKVAGWTAQDRRVHDCFGNYVCSADDAPTLYRFISQESDDNLLLADGHDIPYRAKANE